MVSLGPSEDTVSKRKEGSVVTRYRRVKEAKGRKLTLGFSSEEGTSRLDKTEFVGW